MTFQPHPDNFRSNPQNRYLVQVGADKRIYFLWVFEGMELMIFAFTMDK